MKDKCKVCGEIIDNINITAKLSKDKNSILFMWICPVCNSKNEIEFTPKNGIKRIKENENSHYNFSR